MVESDADVGGAHRGLTRLQLLQSPAMVFADGSERALSANDGALPLLLVRRLTLERPWIASRLWPQVSLDAARNSLRQRIFRLEKAASRPLARKNDHNDKLVLAAGVEHDPGDPYPLLALDPTASCATLLTDLSFAGQPALDDEIHSERQAWSAAFHEALAKLAAEREAKGRVASALACARRLASVDPLSEHAARLLMRLHHQRGDRAAAWDTFDALKQRLFDQLGELPDDETVALAQQIANRGANRRDAPARALPALPMALRHPPDTVGCDDLIAAAQRRLQQGRAVLLSGPAGIGKTRVFEELLRRLPPAARRWRPNGSTPLPGIVT